MDKKRPKRFQMYIPTEIDEAIEFLRYKERISKNKIILEALNEYLPKKLKKYPNYKEQE